jgi:DNA repair and recombination protein RAD52
VKKEVTQSAETLVTNGDSSHGRSLKLSASHLNSRSLSTASHTEIDDDFGLVDFDDADFGEGHIGHPDEVVLPADDQRSSLNTNNSTYQRQDASVPDSVTLPRVGITTPSRPPNAGQFTAPNTTTRAVSTGPTTASNACQGMQPPTGHKAQSNADQIKPIPSYDQQQSSNDTHHSPSPKISSHHVNPHLPQHQHLPSNGAQQIPPTSFYSARAATHVNSDDNAIIPPNIPKFDPHAESPSIRKTAGIDHNKTIPVKRGIGGTPVVASTTVRDGIPPRTNPSRDFVNPSTDMHRRIGAPGMGMQSPGGMTGSPYRPPTRRGPDPSIAGGGGAQSNSTTKRAPLGDISNVHQSNTGAADENDMKRQRISGPENSTMGNHAYSAR